MRRIDCTAAEGAAYGFPLRRIEGSSEKIINHHTASERIENQSIRSFFAGVLTGRRNTFMVFPGGARVPDLHCGAGKAFSPF